MQAKKSGIYYGWVIVAIAAVSALLTTSSTIYSFGLFTHPISQEFKLSRSTFNWGFILFSIANGISAPIIGSLADRVSVRWIMMIGAVLLGGSLITLSFSNSLLLNSILIAGPFALGFVMCGTLCGYVLVARWFVAKRGRAMAIAALGQSASGLIGTPAIAALLQYSGWRPSMLIIGAFVGVVLFILGFLVRDRPHPGENDEELTKNASEEAQTPSDEPVWSVGQLLQSGRFWSLFFSVAIIMSIVSTLMVTLVPYGIEQGLTPVYAATLISWVSLSGILAKFGLAAIADRFERSKLMAICAIMLALFNFALLLEPSYWMLLLTCAVAGFALGTSFPLVAAIVADRFGARSYGTTMGMLAPGIALSAALASGFIAKVFDHTGDYTIAFATFMGLLVLSAALLLYSDRKPRGEKSVEALASG